MYLAYILSNGALGVDPEEVGSIHHYRQYDFIKAKMTADTFRGRARRYFGLVRAFTSQSKR